MERCADCLADIPEDGPEYRVLKRVRDSGHESGDPVLACLDYEPMRVCEDCAGWYGDEAMRSH